MIRVGLVVASQLACDRSTLLLRILAGGRQITAALPELRALPPDSYERATVEPILLQFQRLLELQPSGDPDEEEFSMAIVKSWEEHKADGHAEALFTVLETRGLSVSEAARARIVAERDTAQLKRWLQRAITASSVEDVLG